MKTRLSSFLKFNRLITCYENDIFQCLIQSVHFEGGGRIREHNPPENGVLQYFQKVHSLNIGDTE